MSQQDKGPQDEHPEPIIIQEKITKKSGEVIIKKYEKGKVLGKGGFATCYEIIDFEKDQTLAAKVISKSSLTKKRALEKLLAEIKIHRSLQHESIVHFEHVFEDKENVYIILELCPNQTLKELLKKRKRLTEPEAVAFLVQILNALRYLHSKRIIHRDLKLGNLFLGKALDIKVGDFGLAAKLESDGEKRRTICGTPNYIAPEVLDKKQGHSYEVDIWSLGVICYTLIIGRPPFETNDTKATYRRILNVNYNFPTNVPISDDAKDFIKKILVLDPLKRPTLDELFEHPFIKSNSIHSLLSGPRLDSNSNLKKSLAIPVSKDYLQTLPSDRAIIQRTVGSQGNMKELATEKDLDENDIFVPSSLKGIDKASDGHVRGKTYDMKQAEPIKIPSPLSTLHNKNVVDIQPPNLDVFVSKWIDYSVKYGLGYLLSDGTAGILFNDQTKLTLAADEMRFEFLKKKHDGPYELLIEYNMNSYPKDLKKKVFLTKQFKHYLDGKGIYNLNGKEQPDEVQNQNKIYASKSNQLIYVKKWFKTKSAYMFKLSNKIIQVDFIDKTQIILDTIQLLVYYKNKAGGISQYPLLTAHESDFTEMTKRLKYTKDLLAYSKTPPNQVRNRADRSLHQEAQQSCDFQQLAFPYGTVQDGVIEKLPYMHTHAGLSHVEEI